MATVCFRESECEKWKEKKKQSYHSGSLDQILQFGVTELQADDVEQLVTFILGRLIVADELLPCSSLSPSVC